MSEENTEYIVTLGPTTLDAATRKGSQEFVITLPVDAYDIIFDAGLKTVTYKIGLELRRRNDHTTLSKST